MTFRRIISVPSQLDVVPMQKIKLVRSFDDFRSLYMQGDQQILTESERICKENATKETRQNVIQHFYQNRLK